MVRFASLFVAIALLCVAAPARAADDDKDDSLSHAQQFNLRFGVVFGYRMNFRYEHSPLCRAYQASKAVDAQQQVCGYAAAPAAEVALGFAPLGAIEPFLFGRFGFSGEENTNSKPLKQAGAGVRLYTVNGGHFKLFVEPAVALSFEGGAGDPRWSPPRLAPDYKTDLVFHFGVGPQFDILRYVGVFVNAAWTSVSCARCPLRSSGKSVSRHAFPNHSPRISSTCQTVPSASSAFSRSPSAPSTRET